MELSKILRPGNSSLKVMMSHETEEAEIRFPFQDLYPININININIFISEQKLKYSTIFYIKITC